jgi:hypothetical protein
MPKKNEEKAQAQREGQTAQTEDNLAAAPSPDTNDYELREVEDSPIPGHQEQVEKES